MSQLTLIHTELWYVHTDDWRSQLFGETGNDIIFHMVIFSRTETQLRRIIWNSHFAEYYIYHPVPFKTKSLVLFHCNRNFMTLRIVLSSRLQQAGYACSRYASCYSLYICTQAFGPHYGRKLPLTIEI